MYGNIGLSTAKGSGTSGYVQKSLAFVGNKYQTNSNYKEVLQKFKENPVPQKKKANNEIIEHELKHKIEVELYILMEKLKEDNKLSLKEIEDEIGKKRSELIKGMISNAEGMGLVNFKETHQQSKMKDDQMEKMKNALGVKDEYEFGTAFDVELQEEKRQKRLLERKEEERRIKKIRKEKEKEREKDRKERNKNYIQNKHYHHHGSSYKNPRDKDINRNVDKDKNEAKEKEIQDDKKISQNKSYSSSYSNSKASRSYSSSSYSSSYLSHSRARSRSRSRSKSNSKSHPRYKSISRSNSRSSRNHHHYNHK